MGWRDRYDGETWRGLRGRGRFEDAEETAWPGLQENMVCVWSGVVLCEWAWKDVV